MTQAITTGADIIVKVDPDTRATNLATFPSADVFGFLAPNGIYSPKSSGIFCGAAIGFQSSAVEKILSSGHLTDQKYTRKPFVTPERRYGHPREVIALQDPIVADVVSRLRLTTANWPGLHIRFSWDRPVPPPSGATFIHPVKL
jgi:hypothetical protein